jgi:hypothetical protein
MAAVSAAIAGPIVPAAALVLVSATVP